MYASIRQQSLDRCHWKGDSNGSLALQYVEAWRYDGNTVVDDEDFATGSLKSEADLQTWLARTNALSSKQRQEKLSGSIKLLICERAQYQPLDFSFSRKAFESIETTLNLSPLTVPSVESEPGTYSRFLSFANGMPKKLQGFHTLMKAPQKRELINWGMSLYYDVETSATTGFLYGTDLSLDKPDQTHDRYLQCGHSPLQLFVDSIKGARDAWDHPMLLPSLLLSEHLSCINIFCTVGNVLMETVRIEQALGVTKVGQSAYFEKGITSTSHQQNGSPIVAQYMRGPSRAPPQPQRTLKREDTEALTVQINTQSTRVAFTARSPEWNLACSHFVLKTLEEVESHLPPSRQTGQHECKQLVEHNITLAEAAASNISVIKERMTLQLDVLYNFVAQLDNQTSAELAASASRDSTSMKILAFISALFLPGSFISALFASGLFDWHGEFSDAILSSRFWIYWAITVPLTLITVSGWGLWWQLEMRRFEGNMNSIRGKSTSKNTVKQEP